MTQNISDTVNTGKHSEDGNTKKSSSRSRCWCFTLNNYDANDINFFINTLDTEKFAFQEELGENKTPHLQGVVYFKNAKYFHQMKQLHNKVHWEVSRCLKSSIAYCTDPDKRSGNVYTKGFKAKEKLHLINEDHLYPYQQAIYELCLKKPDDRSIYWFWEPTGNVGKTALIKFLIGKFKNNIHYCSGGKANDICHQINNMSDDCKFFIMNLPRSAEGKVSYNAIEQVKDGLTSSSKYEGGFKIFNPPQVFIFANFPPEKRHLSEDRWNIYEIKNFLLHKEEEDIYTDISA